MLMSKQKETFKQAINKVMDELSEESLTSTLAYVRELHKKESQKTITFKSMVEDFSLIK